MRKIERSYTAVQLEQIQMNLLALLSYVKRHTTSKMPCCFDFCETIVKNIDISRKNGYGDIDELSLLMADDWRNAMDIHVGLPEYNIYNPDDLIRISMNTVISNQIAVIDKLI